MLQPALALAITVAALGALVWIFWPVRGFYWRTRKLVRATDRMRSEDALKHLFDAEYRRVPATLHSVAGALGISPGRAAAVLDRLGRQGLAVGADGAWELTESGREYALRVLRVHRLWEQYLSDRTGLDAAEWHVEADWREHQTTPDEAEAMSRDMGHPRFDPHGDPIPTPAGEMPPPVGCPLSDLPVGEWAEIVHIEDEPQVVYEQLVAADLRPGLALRVAEKTAKRLRLVVGEGELVLAPVVAANVTVAVREEMRPTAALESLSRLEAGEKGRVVALSSACRGAQRRRMLDLGLVPGTVVENVLISPGGDPTAYRIRGALVALRREQAATVEIERLGAGGAA